MNAGMSLTAIVSLLLALATAGVAARGQAAVSAPAKSQTRASAWKIALNHNETMVSDAALVQQADIWSQWLTSVHSFVFESFSTYRPKPGICEDWGCGTNHNETMVSDAGR